MDKINGAGHVAREFVAEDAGTSRPPTEVTAEWLNAVQRELVAVIEGAGLVLSSLDSTQINQAIRKIFQQAAPITAVAGGTVDAITAAFVPVVTTDVAGRIPTVTVMIIATGANTTAGMTIDVGTGAFGVTKGAGAAIVAGDVHGAGHVLHVRGVRGANAAADKWVLLNPAKGISSATEFASATEAQALSSTSKAISPSTLAAAFKGANQSLVQNGFQIEPGGKIEQQGKVTGLAAGANVFVTFPIAFPAAVFTIVTGYGLSALQPGGARYNPHIINPTLTGFTLENSDTGPIDVYWRANGK